MYLTLGILVIAIILFITEWVRVDVVALGVVVALMLTGILTPTGGEVEVGGMVPWKQRQQYTRHIGAVFGQRTQLWWDLAVVESFHLLKKIYEVDISFKDVAERMETLKKEIA